jgi:hypothetical protein
MTTVETAWGTWGLILEGDGVQAPLAAGAARGAGATPGADPAGEALAGTLPTGRDRAPVAVGSISFAPATSVPRLRGLPFHSLTAGSALLFCLWLDEGQPRAQAKRLLQKSLGQLKSRGMSEVFAVAGSAHDAAAADGEAGRRRATPGGRESACGLFSADFLASNGFEPVMESGDLILMRADLRGLLSIIDQVETALRRVIRHEPTPSPAAWTHRGT